MAECEATAVLHRHHVDHIVVFGYGNGYLKNVLAMKAAQPGLIRLFCPFDQNIDDIEHRGGRSDSPYDSGVNIFDVMTFCIFPPRNLTQSSQYHFQHLVHYGGVSERKCNLHVGSLTPYPFFNRGIFRHH